MSPLSIVRHNQLNYFVYVTDFHEIMLQTPLVIRGVRQDYKILVKH